MALVKGPKISFEEIYTPRVLDAGAPLFVGPTITRARTLILAISLFAAFLVLFGRTLQLVVVQGEDWRERSARNRTREVLLPAARGDIRDRHGVILATTVPRFSVLLFPDRLSKTLEAREALFSQIADILGMTRDDIEMVLRDSGEAEYVILKERITHQQALPLMAAMNHPAIDVVFRPEREYTVGRGFGGLLGYTGRVGPNEYQTLRIAGYRRDDLIGKQGIEQAFESTLRGVHGAMVYEVGADGTVQSPSSERPSRAGRSIDLTVDSALQRVAADVFEAVAPNRNGSVVVLDVNSGAVLALVTAPDFSPNDFTGQRDTTRIAQLLQDPRRPLFFRPLVGQYPPGSTLKPFLAAAALARGTISRRTVVSSRGGIQIRDSFFPDWKAGGHGPTTVIRAIAESVNTFFYLAIGGYPFSDGQYPRQEGLGVKEAGEALASFGFSQKSGIGLMEASGLFPTPQWKQRTKGQRWYIGDTYHLSIGQGDVLVTPMQLAVATASLANGGKRFKPFLVASEGERMLERAVSDSHALSIVREGLRAAVTQGSARRLGDLPIAVSGKTGTAQWHEQRPPHSWFTGFAPSGDPRIAVTVLVEEGGEGSGAALSIAKEIFKWYAKGYPLASE